MRVVIAAALLLVLGGEGLAQPAKAAREAEEAFEEGRRLMAAKSYADACAAFELSQRLDPQSGTQFNLAGCYVELGKIATAWKLYGELARSDRNAPRRARSGELAAQLARRVPKLRIRVDRQLAGLEVLVGETDVTPLLGGEIPVDPGPHVIEARLPGHRPFREAVDLDAAGQVREIEVVFERELARPGRPGAEDELARAARLRHGKIAIASGGGVLGFGLFAGWRALANRNAARELCGADECQDRPGSQAKIDRARLWGNLSTVTVIVGAAGIAGGVYLWRTSRSRAALSPAASPGSASLVLRGTF